MFIEDSDPHMGGGVYPWNTLGLTSVITDVSYQRWMEIRGVFVLGRSGGIGALDLHYVWHSGRLTVKPSWNSYPLQCGPRELIIQLEVG